MNHQKKQLEAIRDIRNLMERSSRFLSLSGLAGVVIGITAIAGITAAYLYMNLSLTQPGYFKLILNENGKPNGDIYTFLLIDILVVLLISLVAVTTMAMKKATKNGLPKWDGTAKRMATNLAIPMLTGMVFCMLLLSHGLVAFIAPATLLFYGMALFNASKFTIDDIQYFGILEIITGLLATFFIDYGLIFWAFGFGVLHIVYGIRIYFKYEK